MVIRTWRVRTRSGLAAAIPTWSLPIAADLPCWIVSVTGRILLIESTNGSSDIRHKQFCSLDSVDVYGVIKTVVAFLKRAM